MSVSIVREGALWGLVACHHTAPKAVSYEVREVCKHVAQILSQQIAAREEAQTFHEVRTLTAARQELVSENQSCGGRHRRGTPTAHMPPNLLELLPSDGVAVHGRGVVTTAGHCPTKDQIRELADWLLHANVPRPYSTDRLSESYTPAEV